METRRADENKEKCLRWLESVNSPSPAELPRHGVAVRNLGACFEYACSACSMLLSCEAICCCDKEQKATFDVSTCCVVHVSSLVITHRRL